MRDLLSSYSTESGGVGAETTRRHVSNFTRSTARLSGKPTSSWNLINDIHDQQTLQICKGLKWQHPAIAAATVLSTNMQPYNNNTNTSSANHMAFDESGYFGSGQEQSFGMETDAAGGPVDGGQTGRDTASLMANFTGTMDPSAGFAGLGELSSVAENNLGGTFTGDLNASAYDVGEEDHSQLLQDMLQQQHQQQQQQAQPNQSGQSTTQASQGGASSGSAWEDGLHVLQEMLLLQQQQQAQQMYQSQAEQVFSHAYPSTTTHDRGSNHHHHGSANNTGYNNTGISNKASTGLQFPGESELWQLLQLPRTASPLSSHRGKGPSYSSTSIAGPVNTGDFFESRLGLSHSAMNHHGATQSAASFFHSLPRAAGDVTGSHNNNNNNNITSSLLSPPAPILLDLDNPDRDAEDGKASTTSPFGLKQRDYGGGMGGMAGKGEPRGVNHFATERQRREFLNEKYQTLRSLVPNPTKADRASIVADAIEYVKELKRTVQEVQLLVQEKRRAAGTSRKRSHHAIMDPLADPLPGDTTTTPDSACNSHALPFVHKGNVDAYCSTPPGDGSHLRSSWLQRTSQTGTQVDVRIVHDEVTIKLTQRRRKNCLLDVFGVLQELRLELLQASGASIGEHDVFLFNTKILEGSSTFAGYIAAKMLDAVDHRPLM